MVRKVLDAVAIAALASGVTLQASATAAPVTAAPVVTPAAAPAAVEQTPEQIAAAEAAAATAATAAAAAAAAAATPAAGATAPSVVAPDVVAFLQGQLTAKDAALLAAGVETAGLKAKVTDLEASASGLIKIAAKSLNNMRVALGGSATDVSALTAVQLLAQHEAAVKDFETKFVAGGVAAVDAAQASKNPTAGIDSLEQARLDAVCGVR